MAASKWDDKYIEHVLLPSFEQARDHFFAPMLLASMAHVLMLERQQIIDSGQARRIIKGCRVLLKGGAESIEYDSNYEDLFFIVEARLAEIAGEDAVGNMHLAMSRNDLDTTMYRMVLRWEWAETAWNLLRLRQELLAAAERYARTLMPAHTHNQQAQPTTLGHYLAGVESQLARDTERWLSQWHRLNRSPLGAAALGTSGFKVDRRLTARLLGFDDVVENSYDATGGADYSAEMAAVTQVFLAGLSRFTHDLLFWSTNEADIIKLDASLIQVSSIMPQKRNPVVLEHARAFIRRGIAEATAAIELMVNVPYGDVNDVNDNVQPNLRRMHKAANSVLELLAAVLRGMTVNETLLLERLTAGFTPITELADTLVREAGISFRQAHAITSTIVDRLRSEKNPLRHVNSGLVDEVAKDVIGHPLGLTDELVARACDPANFVAVRQVEGGPAPEVLDTSLKSASKKLANHEAQVREIQDKLAQSMQSFEYIVDEFSSII